MAELEAVIGILSAVCTLYGFSIAYNVFARALPLQEEQRSGEAYWQAECRGIPEGHAWGLWARNAWGTSRRRMRLDEFLIATTVMFFAA